MSEHDRSQLGAYALGALEPDEAKTVHEHLASCAECREELAEFEELKRFLGEVPPEAFLEGPPADGDLLLQHTLRRVRAESATEPIEAGPAAPKRSSWLVAAAAMVVIAGAALGGGVLIGRQTAEPVAGPPVTTPIGTKQGTATDTSTGTTMTATVEPRTGWSWVDVRISGLQAGYDCVLRVTDKDGKVYTAGSWRVSQKAARDGSKFGGGVLIPIDRVKSVDLLTLQGRRLISTPI
jgi:hypothetical protein